jgi:hypothetical protein
MLLLLPMKVKAFLFYVLMLFLLVQPLLVTCQSARAQATACCDQKACHQTEKKQNELPKKCDDGIACNPFASCSQQQFVAVSGISFTESITVANQERINHKNENASVGFLTDCFHPPEMVSFLKNIIS